MYSVYKGEQEIAFGTIKEIAEKLKIKEESVRFYGSASYVNRTSDDARRLVRVD